MLFIQDRDPLRSFTVITPQIKDKCQVPAWVIKFLKTAQTPALAHSSCKKSPLWKQGAANDSLLYKNFTM
jgi:hypothetical protein